MNKTVKTLLTIAVIISIAVLLYYLLGRKKPAPTADANQQQVESSEGVSRWLELPAYREGEKGRFVVTHTAEMGGRIQRNYTLLYDEENLAALWVAYPLCADHVSTGREETWGYDPHIPRNAQTSVSSGYGASEPTENYPKNFYARGHQMTVQFIVPQVRDCSQSAEPLAVARRARRKSQTDISCLPST